MELTKSQEIHLELERLQTEEGIFIYQDSSGHVVFNVIQPSGEMTNRLMFYLVDQLPFREGHYYGVEIDASIDKSDIERELRKGIEQFKLHLKNGRTNPS